MIVLASSSPRRHHLLDMLGIEHEVRPATLPEDFREEEDPVVAARRLALQKASEVAVARPDVPVLGADTIVVLGDAIIGKPASEEDARRILADLSGRTHHVISAVAMVWPRGESVLHDCTRVEFNELTVETIADYVASGEPMDKAGAYGIQGLGAPLVRRIEGDYFGVMGLPLQLVLQLMRNAGVPYRFTR
jgi:septum formation protein